MKRYLALFLVFVLVFTASPVLAKMIDPEEQIIATAPADPEYGYKSSDSLISEINASIDALAESGGIGNVKALSLKKRLADVSALSARSRSENLPETDRKAIASELGAIFSEVEGLLGVTRGGENSAALAPIKDKIERLSANSGNFDSCNGLTNEALKAKLYELIKDQKALGYNGQARVVLFSKLDNVNGKVRCVYTGREVACNSVPSANPPQAMNTEHTWPKSLGAGSEPAKSDLNHLYPTDTFANSTRSSYPFGEFPANTATWSQGGSAFNGDVYMPREDHRGKVARAYFYFAVRYKLHIPADEEKTLREWHKKYPVTPVEVQRNEKVFQFQGNRNPFVDRPDFVDKIDRF